MQEKPKGPVQSRKWNLEEELHLRAVSRESWRWHNLSTGVPSRSEGEVGCKIAANKYLCPQTRPEQGARKTRRPGQLCPQVCTLRTSRLSLFVAA